MSGWGGAYKIWLVPFPSGASPPPFLLFIDVGTLFDHDGGCDFAAIFFLLIVVVEGHVFILFIAGGCDLFATLNCRHPHELPRTFRDDGHCSNAVELHVCHRMMGLGGDNSWSPAVCVR